MIAIRAVEIDPRAAHEKETKQDADHQRDQQPAALCQCGEYHVVGRVGQRRGRIAAKPVGIEQRFARLQDLVACALRVACWIEPVDKAVGDLLDLREHELHRTEVAGTACDRQQRHAAGGQRCASRNHDGENRSKNLDIRHKQKDKTQECAQNQQERTELALDAEKTEVEQRDKDGSPDPFASGVFLGTQQTCHHEDVDSLVKFGWLQRHPADADPVADAAANRCTEDQCSQIQRDGYAEQNGHAMRRCDDRHTAVQESGDQTDDCRQRIVDNQRSGHDVFLQQHALDHRAKGEQHCRVDKKRGFCADTVDDQPSAVRNNEQRDHHIQICRPAPAYHYDKQRNQLEQKEQHNRLRADGLQF